MENVYKIKLIGLNNFFIKTPLSAVEIKKQTQAFEKQRGQYGFRMMKAEERYSLMKQYATELQVQIAYYSTLDREIKIRERDANWVRRRLKDNGYGISKVQLNKYIYGKVFPANVFKVIMQNLLEFKWD